MKVALIVFRWVGLAASIGALLGDLTLAFTVGLPINLSFLLMIITIPLIPFVAAPSIFAIIVNSIGIAKHAKQQQSIGFGVLQCITITGIPAGVVMIIAASFNKKLAAQDEVVEEVVEYVVEE